MLMKKALLIGLVLGLASVWTAPAMAVDLTAFGYIGMKGYIGRNSLGALPPFMYDGLPPTPGPPGWRNFDTQTGNMNQAGITAFTPDNQTGSFINSRVELGFNLRASEDLFGVVALRMESGNFGTGAGFGGNQWGTEGGTGFAVNVVNAFIDFRIPQMPVWVRVGLQPVLIRPWIFLVNNQSGITMRTVIDPIKLSATGYFIKLQEPGVLSASGGAELFAIDTKIPLSLGALNIAPGLFFAWQNERIARVLEPDARDLWWIGVNFDGGIPPVGFQFDFIYNGGTEKYDAFMDADYSSWLVNGQVSAIFKKLEVGVAGKYVEGENVNTYDYEGFQLPGTEQFGSESMAASGDFVVWDHGWMMPGPGWAGTGLIDGPATFWYGYWDVRVFAYYQLLEWLRLGAQVGYIGDTVSGVRGGVGGDALGNDAEDDDSIGWEFDVGFNVQIYKNLSLQTAFGYLIAHKALSQAGGIKPEDPWSLSSRLMYTF
jgi:hypothetical protein